MECLQEILAKGFNTGQDLLDEKHRMFQKVENSLDAYLVRAKEKLHKKHLINPKPVKRPMRVIQDESEDEEEQRPSPEVPVHESLNESLRPVRTAKAKAAENLKEAPLNSKMRNDQNSSVIVNVKKERSSTISSSTSGESIKENKIPDKDLANQKRKSPDEGIQSATESEGAISKNCKRSNSVELISDKMVSIDITEENEMPPPAAMPKKAAKKAKSKQTVTVTVLPVEEPEPQALRVTRSKIKQEKISIVPAQPTESEVAPQASTTKTTSRNESKVDESVKSKKPKKKYPVPLLVKIEPTEELPLKKNSRNNESDEKPEAIINEAAQTCNDTYRVEPTVNETVTIAPAANETETIASNVSPKGDTTVTLSKNAHDSLMTSDNDENENSLDDIPPPLPPKLPKHASTTKLKKNEVFNPYLSSPVKQKVQAFEKHAFLGSTPDKYNTLPAKFNAFKNGTPSKIALYSKTTTPMSLGKHPKIASCSSGSFLTASAPGHGKKPQKMNSLSQESLDETRKNQSNTLTQLLEEKRKNREEKMRQAQLQREAIEKEKREQVLKLQQERDEKYRKIMREKEEKLRMEAMKKKILKEKQAKKYAEEKAKSEFVVPKPVETPGALTKNDSLHKKLQKSILSTKKKNESSNVYSFDMLNTDDETDDESRPSTKRPPIPEWSLKKARKPLMQTQSFVAPAVLDTFFGTAPISVDLRAIFPSIEAKKLIRNSSAIWRTPPKHY